MEAWRRPERAPDARALLRLEVELERAGELTDDQLKAQAHLALIDELLSTGQLDRARDQLVAARDAVAGASAATRRAYQTRRVRYYLRRGRPQDVSVPADEALDAMDAEQQAAQGQALRAAQAELELALAQQALLLGQRQRAQRALAAAQRWAAQAQSAPLSAAAQRLALEHQLLP